jgi:predicted enzyme related to lactoylglutathione lyase
MYRVIHFEIGVNDPDRAVKFYKGLFGWEFKLWEWWDMKYWMIMTGDSQTPGIDGGLFKRDSEEGTDGKCMLAYQCVIEVPDVSAYEGKIRNAGGAVIMPKMAIPGMGWYSRCRDTEGNYFALMQNDVHAK